jgi:farnesyl diphosphate synthase
MAVYRRSQPILSDVATMIPLADAMADGAAAVERVIDSVLAVPEGPEKRVFEAMRYSSLGAGKRLRPFLALASARVCGAPDDQALRVGAAVELIHCYSLIHDDLPAMDDDDLRRGKPSCHKAFDDATAILAGDALQAMAFEVLADPKTHPNGDVRSELVAALAIASGGHGMVGGQMIDLAAENTDADVAMITRIQRLKTGALIRFSAESGAIVAQASAVARQALVRYAHDLGLAFQIVDDLLDATSTAEDLGKATQKDEAAGKATFVSLLGIDKARERAQLLVGQAIAHLDIFDAKAAHLRSIAEFVVERRT